MSLKPSTPMKAPGTEHMEDLANEKHKHQVEKKSSYDEENFIHSVAEHGGITHNPLKNLSREQLMANVDSYIKKHDFEADRQYFERGAILAQTGETDHLPEDEKSFILQESEHKWRQPFTLYWLCIMCAMCAIVQGMDETVVNGAQTYFNRRFKIQNDDQISHSEWIQGLVVGAPYLCCAVFASALTEPLNNLFGRRGVIFISCFIAAIASIWEAFTYSWVQMFLARLLLGVGIGPKSTTVPVYSAECTPAPIRGALVMMWQMWTAFGIMLGYIFDVAFQPNSSTISENVGWRLMMGSTVAAPVLVCIQVFFVPESPRWYIKKNRYGKAYESLKILRPSKVQAARDMYYMSTLIEINDELNRGRSSLVDISAVGRNRRALYASQIVMFMQQFCGVNVIAYYSSTIFLQSGFSETSALLASLGWGIINWLFAIPAVFTIDTFGRRSLALFTLPFLALFLLFTGMCFKIPNEKARTGCITLGLYIYGMFYSPGMGPVPFTYSAEAFPLHVRDVGMSLATITLWGFNFILSLTWPALLKRLGAPGAFGYYAAWNVVGFFLVFFFVPETKGLTLEELDITFSVPTPRFISYQLKNLPYNIKRNIFFQRNLGPKPKLYELY